MTNALVNQCCDLSIQLGEIEAILATVEQAEIHVDLISGIRRLLSSAVENLNRLEVALRRNEVQP